jgi:putative spermidine/putrescine transport system substrate-binding protein
MKLILLLLVLNSAFAVTWTDHLVRAKGRTVSIALWGGSENINNWFDTFVKDQLKEKYNITLERIPLSDTQIAIQKLLKEKKRNRLKGSIDLLWVNGENFKTMKDKKLTWKSYLGDLPSSKYLDLESSAIKLDFGVDHGGHESPWGSAQMVFIYDSAKVSKVPTTISGLKKWIMANPGRFTYSSPPDFTGSAFVRQTFMNLISKDDYKNLQSDFNKNLFNSKTNVLWDFLRDIKPSLYRKGKYYPESVSKLHTLFSDGKTWITMDYYPTTAQRMIDKGVFPKTTKTFILEEGSLSNTHFLSVPFNSPEKSAALVAANFLLSPEAQASKLDPNNWGDFTVLSLDKLSKSDKKIFDNTKLGDATLSLEELNDQKVGELQSKYVPLMEKLWNKNILNK